jgi:hypothetical protein
MALYIDRIDEKTIRIKKVQNGFEVENSVAFATFKAAIGNNRFVVITDMNRNSGISYSSSLSELYIDGVLAPQDINGAIKALTFIGNFKSGGGASANAENIVFDTEAQMNDWLAGTYERPDGLTPADLKTGESIYIRATDEPDYWWDGTQALEMETKTDLSGYYDKSEVDGLLDDKVDKVSGKGLSTNDYTTAEKNKLDGINTYVTEGLIISHGDNAVGIREYLRDAGSGLTAESYAYFINAASQTQAGVMTKDDKIKLENKIDKVPDRTALCIRNANQIALTKDMVSWEVASLIEIGGEGRGILMADGKIVCLTSYSNGRINIIDNPEDLTNMRVAQTGSSNHVARYVNGVFCFSTSTGGYGIKYSRDGLNTFEEFNFASYNASSTGVITALGNKLLCISTGNDRTGDNTFLIDVEAMTIVNSAELSSDGNKMFGIPCSSNAGLVGVPSGVKNLIIDGDLNIVSQSPNTLQSFSSAYSNGKFYFTTNSNVIEVYDVASDTWSQIVTPYSFSRIDKYRDTVIAIPNGSSEAFILESDMVTWTSKSLPFGAMSISVLNDFGTSILIDDGNGGIEKSGFNTDYLSIPDGETTMVDSEKKLSVIKTPGKLTIGDVVFDGSEDKTVTTATQIASGLMSKDDKIKLDQLFEDIQTILASI